MLDAHSGQCCDTAPAEPSHGPNPASCCLPADVNKAVEQLAVRARILVYVLATTNAPLLKVLGPLKVVGTVHLVGRPLSFEQQRFWAGQQRDVSCSAAPETAGLTIQLWLRPLACVPARRGGWLARPAPFS